MAQTTPQEMMLQSVYKLQQSQNLTFQASGQEMRGTRLVQVLTSVAFHIDLDNDLAQLEFLSLEDGKLVQRIAADGTRIWNFDAREKTYSSRSYTDSDGKLLNNWRESLFKTYKKYLTGIGAFVSKPLDDTFGLGLVKGAWSPWISTSELKRSNNMVIGKSDSPTENQTTYLFDGDDSLGFSLSQIKFNQWNSRGQEIRNWTCQVYPNELPKDTDFRFIPPKGAHAIASGTN